MAGVLSGFVPKDEYMRVVRRLEKAEAELQYLKSEIARRTNEHEIFALQQAFKITAQQARLMSALAAVPKNGFASRYALADQIADNPDRADSNLVSVVKCRLGQKLGADTIEKLWGHGYRLTEKGRALYQKALDDFASQV